VIFIEETRVKVKYEFTYLDYLYFCDRENWKRIVNGQYPKDEKEEFIAVNENGVEYVYDEVVSKEKDKKKTGDKKHDKIFKDILQNREEIAQFINQFVNYDVKAEELEIYNPNYITNKFEYKNADIVYKIKNKELYFLIEHQTKVDYSMAYRIFNYCLEIMRSVIENKEINKMGFRYPRIVPIVIYTGNRKWSSSKSFAKVQEGESLIEIDEIDVKYKLVDVNEYDTDELLEEHTMLTNAMVLEKCKNDEDIITCLSKIRKSIKNDKQLQQLKRIVGYLYGSEDEITINEIVKILNEGESEKDMSSIIEKIRRESLNEKRAAKVEGILQAVKQIVEQMIKMNLEDDFIKQVTGAKKSEIEKIRKEMAKA